MIVLTLPDKIKEPTPGAKSSNFLENFTSLSSYGRIGFLLFIIIITVIISTYPGGFFKKDNTQVLPIMTLVMGIVVLWIIMIGANLYDGPSSSMDTWKKSLLFLFWQFFYD
jgi:hypothetical protein